jgi:hypothetical protein
VAPRGLTVIEARSSGPGRFCRAITGRRRQSDGESGLTIDLGLRSKLPDFGFAKPKARAVVHCFDRVPSRCAGEAVHRVLAELLKPDCQSASLDLYPGEYNARPHARAGAAALRLAAPGRNPDQSHRVRD